MRRLLVAQDGQVSQLGVGNRDHDIVLGEELRIGQSDADLLVLLLFDGDRLFEAVVVQTQALDRHIILTGRNSGDVDPVLLVSGKHLVDNTGTRVVEAIKNNQHGIRMVLGVDVGELETNGAGIHDFSRGGGCSGCRSIDFAIIRVTSDGGDCKSNESDKLFHTVRLMPIYRQSQCQSIFN